MLLDSSGGYISLMDCTNNYGMKKKCKTDSMPREENNVRSSEIDSYC